MLLHLESHGNDMNQYAALFNHKQKCVTIFCLLCSLILELLQHFVIIGYIYTDKPLTATHHPNKHPTCAATYI